MPSMFERRVACLHKVVLIALAAGCGSDPASDPGFGLREIPVATAPEGPCVASANSGPEFLRAIGCRADFDQLAAVPFSAAIPGARSVKVVVDRAEGNAVYFQNTVKFPLHWNFATAHLSGNGKPLVPALSSFNQTEYYSPDRRFILAAVTFYEQPRVWALELAPYDGAGPEMVTAAFTAIKAQTYFGPDLVLHPTSTSAEQVARALGPEIPVLRNEVLFSGITYQPLNLATSYGRLRFVKAADLHKIYLSFRDIVVLDRVPNDISTVVGIITQEVQTPLSHLNVLSQNRGTPNMSLQKAMTAPTLRALENKWVKLTVGPFAYEMVEAPVSEADQWWESHKPAAVGVPRMDLAETGLKDITTIIPAEGGLKERVKAAIPAYGGKASHYAALAQIPEVPSPKAFAVPVFYYQQFLIENGFVDRIAAMLADPAFRSDPAQRDRQLAALRAAMIKGRVNAAFEAALIAKCRQDYPGVRLKFRSSTNAEDLEGFTGAGLYESHSGQPGDPDRPVMNAVRRVWASVWLFRAFEEREYRSIDHLAVGMALLVHRSFSDEEVNGVALTANPFDAAGVEPAFYVNAQKGESSVVQPPPGTSTDEFIYHYYAPGQPLVFLQRSSLVRAGTSVMTPEQTFALGAALDRIHEFFRPAYGTGGGFYAMDVEFKFDGEKGQPPTLYVKQARPHPGRGQAPAAEPAGP